MCISEKSAKSLLQKHKTVSKIVNTLHNCNVGGKSKSGQGFSSLASPCNGRISIKCPADLEKYVMPDSTENDKKEQQ